MMAVTSLVAESAEVHWLPAGPSLPTAARKVAAGLAALLTDAARAAAFEQCATAMAGDLLAHAPDGVLALRATRVRGQGAVECLSIDGGPGARAPQPGVPAPLAPRPAPLVPRFSGLEGLVDSFVLHSARGSTVACARSWLAAPPPPAPLRLAGLTRPYPGEHVVGDAWAVREAPEHGRDAVLVLMCDGLGHGPLAALAASRAREVFRDAPTTDPAPLLRLLHEGMRGTRGAALALALVTPDTHRVRLGGVGNIAAFVTAADASRHSLASLPGIVGSVLPAPRVFEAPYPPGAVLVLHSDGLSERRRDPATPLPPSREPLLVAAQLLNQAAIRRDDAGLVVIGHVPA
ncbi:SpoIIE family protein phosphatase [Streptomyces sp. DSM 41982]|uniref:SpoIIE family protein phosphatase n=1 Tax=Streptomyces evansiae TaxID=3075535 RepID=A0ABD5DZJ9_9ACTN|nr:SpoIIE family protein phosphatase [Streptomyces sp. DSM 41982]MDT0414530.1 SpoIIE family protein phosphatase [Streptomyces sp. DSM 41982]